MFRGNHRAAAGHGLQHHIRHPFPGRWEHQQIAGGQDLGNISPPAGKMDPLAEARSLGSRLKYGPQGTIANHQEVAIGQSSQPQRGRIDQPVHALLTLEPADERDYAMAPRDAERCQIGGLYSRILLQIDAVRDHGHFFPRQARSVTEKSATAWPTQTYRSTHRWVRRSSVRCQRAPRSATRSPATTVLTPCTARRQSALRRWRETRMSG